MVTHSPATARGLKILVSAVRFCPWPHPNLLEFSRLQALASRLSFIGVIHFGVYLEVCCCWSSVTRINRNHPLSFRSAATFTEPVSFSRVMKTTPPAVLGRCRQMTSRRSGQCRRFFMAAAALISGRPCCASRTLIGSSGPALILGGKNLLS